MKVRGNEKCLTGRKFRVLPECHNCYCFRNKKNCIELQKYEAASARFWVSIRSSYRNRTFSAHFPKGQAKG